MTEGEIRIRITPSIQGNALDEASKKVDDLRKKEEDARRGTTPSSAPAPSAAAPAAAPAPAPAPAQPARTAPPVDPEVQRMRDRAKAFMDNPDNGISEAEMRRREKVKERETAASPAAAKSDAREEAAAQKRAEREARAAEKAEADKSTKGQGRRDYLDQLHAMERRASGNVKEAEALERSNAIRARAVQLEQQLGFSREKAVQLATREVDAVNKGGRGGGMGGIGGLGGVLGMLGGVGGAVGLAVGAVHEITGGINASTDAAGTIRDSNLAAAQRGRAAGYEMRGAASAGEYESLRRSRETEVENSRNEADRLQDELKKNQGASRWGRLATSTIAGMGSGALAGSWVPGVGTAIGAGVGAAVGLGAGVFHEAFTEAPKNAAMEKEIANKRARGADAEKEMAELKRLQAGYLEREIGMTEKLAQGKVASAKADKMALDWHKEYRALRDKGASTEQAARGADAAFQSDLRDREQSLGGLIGARTGSKSAARIAALGDRQYGEAREAVGAQRAIEKLHETVMANHTAATTNTGLRRSTRPSLAETR